MKKRTNTRWLTQLALLVAVLLVMNYTPLGYLQVGPLSMYTYRTADCGKRCSPCAASLTCLLWHIPCWRYISRRAAC